MRCLHKWFVPNIQERTYTNHSQALPKDWRGKTLPKLSMNTDHPNANPEKNTTKTENYRPIIVQLLSHAWLLWPHGLQHSRFTGPSPSPTFCSNSCPINSDAIQTIHSLLFLPFSSCLQSFPASGLSLMNRYAKIISKILTSQTNNKTTVRYHLTLLRMDIIKKSTNRLKT